MMNEKNLPVSTSNQFIEKTNQLSVSLEKTQGEIEGLIRKVSSTTPPVVEGHWYKLGGTSKSDINAALNKVCTITSGSIKLLGEAEAKQNNAINELRQLIQALFLAEAEMYQRVERQYTLNNETANLTNDLERQLDRSSRQADDLNTAFLRLTEIHKQRAISQKELKEVVLKCQEEISSLKKKPFDEKNLGKIEHKVQELENSLNSFQKEARKSEELIELIKSSNETLNNKFGEELNLIVNKSQESLSEIKSNVEAQFLKLSEELGAAAKALSEETAARESAIEQTNLQLKQELSEQAKASQEALSEHKSNVEAQFLKLSEELGVAAKALSEETAARESAIEQTKQAIQSEINKANDKIAEIERRNRNFFYSLPFKISISFIAIASLALSLLSILGII